MVGGVRCALGLSGVLYCFLEAGAGCRGYQRARSAQGRDCCKAKSRESPKPKVWGRGKGLENSKIEKEKQKQDGPPGPIYEQQRQREKQNNNKQPGAAGAPPILPRPCPSP